MNDDEFRAHLIEINNNIRKYKNVRFWIMSFVQGCMGLMLISIPEKQYVSQSYLLDKLAISHKQYGLIYLSGLFVLLVGRAIGPISMRIAHAILAGFWALLSIVIFSAIFTGHQSNAITFPLYMFLSWEHMRAGQGSVPLTRQAAR